MRRHSADEGDGAVEGQEQHQEQPVAHLGLFLDIHPQVLDQQFWSSPFVEELWLRADTWGGVLGLATNLILVRILTARLAHAGWFAQFYFLHLLASQLALLVLSQWQPAKYVRWRHQLMMYSRLLRLLGSIIVWRNLPGDGAIFTLQTAAVLTPMRQWQQVAQAVLNPALQGFMNSMFMPMPFKHQLWLNLSKVLLDCSLAAPHLSRSLRGMEQLQAPLKATCAAVDWTISLLLHAPSAASVRISSCDGGDPLLLIAFVSAFVGSAVPLLLTYSYERAVKRKVLQRWGYRVPRLLPEHVHVSEGLALGLALHVSALLCWGASYLVLRLLRA